MVSRAARIDIEMPVELRFDDSEAIVVERCLNISETGMLVLTKEARPRGTPVRFEFGPRFKGMSEVIWAREAEERGTLLGLRFHPLDRTARKALEGLLKASV